MIPFLSVCECVNTTRKPLRPCEGCLQSYEVNCNQTSLRMEWLKRVGQKLQELISKSGVTWVYMHNQKASYVLYTTNYRAQRDINDTSTKRLQKKKGV